MMAFLPMGSTLERALGSFQLFWLILLLSLGGNLLYLAVSYLAAAVGYPSLLSHCAVGFSGVIFGLIPLDIRASGGTHRSIFGLFTVPSKVYPWILLVLWQVLVPQSSFLGHLGGLAVGQLYVMGLLRWIVPSADTIQRWERGAVLSRCTASSSYIANTGSSGSADGLAYESLLPVHHGESHAAGGPTVSQHLQRLFRGPWMAYPSVLSPTASASASAQGEGQSGSSGSSGQQNPPIGAVLGGRPAELDPKAAAAAAAEARLAKTAPPQP